MMGILGLPLALSIAAYGCPLIKASAPTRQLGDIRRDPPRLGAGEHLGGRSYRPILPAFAIIVPGRRPI